MMHVKCNNIEKQIQHIQVYFQDDLFLKTGQIQQQNSASGLENGHHVCGSRRLLLSYAQNDVHCKLCSINGNSPLLSVKIMKAFLDIDM